jgi:NAD+ synthase (glutamine-hydrolysing)
MPELPPVTRVALFPELGLSAYSNEDLFHQDALLDASEAALERVVEASRDLAPVLLVGVPLRWRGSSTTAPSSSTGDGCSAWCPRATCPTTASSTRSASSPPGDDLRGTIRLAGRRRRSARPGVRAGDLPGFVCTSRSARTCGCRSRRALRSALAGARCSSTCRLERSPSARPTTAGCCAAASVGQVHRGLRLRRAGEGESTTDLAWDGQALIYENGLLLAETERFADGPQLQHRRRRPRALRAERMRMTTFDDNRRTHARAPWAVPHRAVRGRRRPPATSALRRGSSASRSCPPTRARDERLLRGLQHPGVRPRAAPPATGIRRS